MKVCLIVCVALAHLAAGSIFKRHHQRPPKMESLYYQTMEPTEQQQQQRMYPQSPEPLDYIENYNRQLQQQQQKYEEAQRFVKDNSGSNSDEVRAQEPTRFKIPEYVPRSQPSWNAPSYVSAKSSQKQQMYEEAQRFVKDNSGSNSDEVRAQEPTRFKIPEYVPRSQPSWNAPSYDSAKSSQKQMKYTKPRFADSVAWKSVKIATGPKSPISNKKDIERIFKDSFDTVKDFSEEEKKTFHETYMSGAENVDVQLNATALLQKYEYPVEEHTVQTDDGYILTLIRIPPKQKTRDLQQRPVVFLMHGLLGSADDWLLMGPGKSLAYLLADADYDVWMGNARGSKYSRKHVSKHPGQPDFWQFSNDEIALHDLPAMIDYALNTSNQQKMYYVGYSEGTTAFFALASTRKEYNDKITMMYALSPMVYMTNARSPLMKMIAPNSLFFESLQQALGDGEFKPSPELIQTMGGDMLAAKTGCKHVAFNVIFAMAGMVDNNDAHIVPMIESHLPAGASTRQIKQYGQSLASQEFRRYDYGSAINKEVYGSELPPKYEISSVQMPVTLYYSSADWLAHPTDVQKLQMELPQVKEAYQVPEELFSHLDFQFSHVAPQVVYQRLIESIQNNE